MPLIVDEIDSLSADTVLINGVSVNKNGTGTIQMNGAAVESTALNAVIIGADTGVVATAFANGNDSSVLIGQKAGKMTTSGANNIMIGAQAGTNNSTGYSNLFVGSNAGENNTTGFSNLFIGQMLNDTIYNPFIGNNNISIDGTCTSASASGEITLGNLAHTVLRCAVTSITSLSDARDKTNIEESTYGLDLVKSLKPVTFEWDTRDGAKKGVKDLGFIAQDLKELDDDHLGLVYSNDPEKLEASYGRLIPVLVKAIQDLSAKVEALEAKKK
jgi:hypothetical protein